MEREKKSNAGHTASYSLRRSRDTAGINPPDNDSSGFVQIGYVKQTGEASLSTSRSPQRPPTPGIPPDGQRDRIQADGNRQ